jgi:outer membrane protein OmpA-like peptidoglycan-associated protein
MKTFFALAMAVLFLTGCAGRQKPAGPEYFNSIAELSNALAKDIAAQTTPNFFVKSVPVDEVFNETSAEVSTSSAELQTQLAAALTKAVPLIKFQPASSNNVTSATWIVLVSYSPADSTDRSSTWLRVRAALTDVSSGKRLAFAESYLHGKAFNTAPTRYYKEAPMYNTGDPAFKAKMAAIKGDGSTKLASTLSLATTYAEAIAYYEDGQFSVASKKFFDVLSVSPNHLGALSGLYQSYWYSGLKKEAEQAFTMLAEAGIDSGSVSAKILFSVASTNFIANQDLAEQYKVWQKGLTQAVVSRGKCLDVIGHASKTGGDSFNEKLSLQRASRIVSNMLQLVPSGKGKLTAIGKGSSQVIVGSGTDDASDAIDRRVEFAVRSCS